MHTQKTTEASAVLPNAAPSSWASIAVAELFIAHYLDRGSLEVGAHVRARSVCVVALFLSEERTLTWTLRPPAILHRLLPYHAMVVATVDKPHAACVWY